MLKRAIVVGASSGIGAALVNELVDSGYIVAAVARREQALERVCGDANQRSGDLRAKSFIHDVTDLAAVEESFAAAVAWLDGLDVVIYAAGVMPEIREDQFDSAIDAKIVHVNVIGAIAWLNLAAQRFQIQGSGAIVGIGSVAGERGRRGNPVYNASKAALHTYLEALRNRLSQHGVRVVTIKPGPVNTEMTAGREGLKFLIEAERAAQGIVRAIHGGPEVRYIPIIWLPIMTVIRAIPSLIFRRMSF